jgi:hypothetical protein
MVTEVKHMPKGKTGRPAPKPKQEPPKRKAAGEAAGVILIALGIFLGVCVFIKTNTGLLGGAFRDVLFGLFGLFVYLVPFALVAWGIVIIAARSKKGSAGKKALVILIVVAVFSLTHTIVLNRIDVTAGFFSYVASSYKLGLTSGAGGGAVGCLLVYPCYLLIGPVGCVILFITMLFVSVLVLTGLSLKRMSQGVVDAGKRTVEMVRVNAEERRQNKLYIENLREEEEEEPPFDTGKTREPEILTKESFRKKKPMPSYFDDEQFTTRNVELAMPGDPAPVMYAPPKPPVQSVPERRGGFSIEEPVQQPAKETAKYVPSIADESSDILPPEAKKAEEPHEPPVKRRSW